MSSWSITTTKEPIRGKHCQGRTPMQTFEEGRKLYQKYVYENFEVEKDAA